MRFGTHHAGYSILDYFCTFILIVPYADPAAATAPGVVYCAKDRKRMFLTVFYKEDEIMMDGLERWAIVFLIIFVLFFLLVPGAGAY
ncbi:hypothetical protein LLE49_25020 [Alicyclobacillus tolerans]|uniref:hypothetical protein n=1 Tax=Alicyclobacillus tolerans TaxID=90970 RepID=UPI001F34591A|nr:hypothetical protein [Alicyclobacillus tolerans]MCF8567990.1 hypothetical protein [Alicyclobacillus tolerans]